MRRLRRSGLEYRYYLYAHGNFIGVLKQHNIRISLDGRGLASDNIFVERFWRTIKYEYVFIDHPNTGEELYHGLATYIEHYNRRLHQSLGCKALDEIYRQVA